MMGSGLCVPFPNLFHPRGMQDSFLDLTHGSLSPASQPRTFDRTHAVNRKKKKAMSEDTQKVATGMASTPLPSADELTWADLAADCEMPQKPNPNPTVIPQVESATLTDAEIKARLDIKTRLLSCPPRRTEWKESLKLADASLLREVLAESTLSKTARSLIESRVRKL